MERPCANCAFCCCLFAVAMVTGATAIVPCAASDDEIALNDCESEEDDPQLAAGDGKAQVKCRRRAEPPLAPVAEAHLAEWTVQLGGQVRARADFGRSQNLTDFTVAPDRDESQLLQRSRFNASIGHSALDATLFLQGQWYGRWGGVDRRSDLDLYQGYLEWANPLGLPITLRAGRQELSYGSMFFIGPNDFYNGLAWDGLKATVRPIEDLAIEAVASRMAQLNPGDPEIYLTGVYTSYRFGPDTGLDGYLFYNRGGFPFFHREFELEDSGQQWFTLGARATGKSRGFDAEFEPQFQWGRVNAAMGDGKDDVRAYGGHIDLGYTAPLRWRPRVFGAYALGSGHNDIAHGRYGEFHGTLFNDTYLVGDTSVVTDLSGVTMNGVHASGMHVAVGGISVTPVEVLTLVLDAHRFVADKTPDHFSKDIGVEVNLAVGYKPSERVCLLFSINRFLTGQFFRQTTGSSQNVDYVYVQAQLEL